MTVAMDTIIVRSLHFRFRKGCPRISLMRPVSRIHMKLPGISSVSVQLTKLRSSFCRLAYVLTEPNIFTSVRPSLSMPSRSTRIAKPRATFTIYKHYRRPFLLQSKWVSRINRGTFLCRLMFIAASVFELSFGKIDRQTDRQTEVKKPYLCDCTQRG